MMDSTTFLESIAEQIVTAKVQLFQFNVLTEKKYEEAINEHIDSLAAIADDLQKLCLELRKGGFIDL